MEKNCKELFEKFEAVSGVGFWRIDLETKENYWSQNFYEISGFDSTNTIPSTELGLSLFHSEDRAEIKLAIESATITLEQFQIESRIVSASGEVKYVILEGTIESENDDTQKILLISCKDITRSKITKGRTKVDYELKSLLECSIDLIFLFNKEGLITKVSNSVLETLGYPLEEVIGMRPIDFLYPSDVEKSEKVTEEIRSGQKIKRFKNRYLDAKGNLVYLNWTACLKKETGEILGVARNFTEIVEIKNKQKRENIRIQTILNSSPDLIWSLDLDFKLLSANRAFLKLMKTATNWEIKPGDNLLSDAINGKETLNFWEKNYRKAFKGKKVKIESKIDSKNENATIYFETKINPIYSHGEIIGLACFSRDITENKNNKERIIELNKKFLRGQELSKTGYWESDLLTNLLYWSDEMYKIWEVKNQTDKVLLDFLFTSIHPEDRQDFLYHRNRAVSGEKNLDFVYRIITQNGNLKYIHELGEKGDSNTLRGTAQEITKEKEHELKLKERNSFIEAILENIPLGVAVNKISDGEFTFVNKAFEKIYGWPKNEFLYFDSFFEKVYSNPEYRTWIKSQMLEDIRSGDPARLNWNNILVTTKNKDEKIVNTKSIPAPDLNLMISTVSDDTERYLAEQALRVSNDRFKLVSEAVSDAIWDWDLVKNSVFWGSGFHKLFGYSEEQNQIEGENWMNYIHPEDRKKIAQSIQNAKNNKSLKYWSGEYRFKKNDGDYAFVIEKAIIIRDNKGEALRMVGALQDTTKEKERENHLKLLESVVTNTKDSILITKPKQGQDGYEIIYCNKAFSEMTGYKREEILGKSPKILVGKDSNQNAIIQLKKAIREKKSTSVDTINNKKDGSPFWVNISLVPLTSPAGNLTHWIVIERDISEKKKKELELELINERFRLISKATNDVIYDWELVKGKQFWGDGFSKIFGIDLLNDEDFSLEWSKKIHPEDLERVNSYFSEKTLIKNDLVEYEIEYRVQKPNNKFIYVLDSGQVIRNEEGFPIRMIGAIQDINNRKEYESSLQSLNIVLEKSNRQLEHSNRELEQFAYVASHDLQEPLRMITSFLGLLEKRYNDVLDESGRKYIHFAVDGAKRMKQIILDLLEFSKLDSFQESKTWLDTNELVEKSKLFINWKLRRNTPVFNLTKLPQVYGHKSRLIQLFQNIISNAIKYQPKGQTPEIWISGNEKKDYWEFAVRDNGIGLENEYLEKIFIIFQRLHTSDQYSGTGIGLAISKKIIDQHDGKIWVESQQGKGSTFFFTIKKPEKI